MNFTCYSFLRLAPVVLAIVFSSQSLIAQVNTRFLSSEEELTEYLPWIFEEGPAPISCDAPALESAVFAANDAIAQQRRIGVPQPMDLTHADGEFYDRGSYIVWKLELSADRAKSLHVVFTDVNLPARTQMVVYSRENSMFHGAISSKDLVDGNYFADLMVGGQAIVEVVMPADAKEDFALSIPAVVYGVADQSHLLQLPDAGYQKVPVVNSGRQ